MSVNIPTYIPIDPIEKIKRITYTKMEIKILNMPFGDNSCEIQVLVYDDNMDNLKSFCYLITGADYLNWTTDNYVINWVKSKLKQEIF